VTGDPDAIESAHSVRSRIPFGLIARSWVVHRWRRSRAAEEARVGAVAAVRRPQSPERGPVLSGEQGGRPSAMSNLGGEFGC
jgi:hypothetical protein